MGHIFSQPHSEKPQKKKRRRRKAAPQEPKTSIESSLPAVTALTPALSDEQRIALRARQLREAGRIDKSDPDLTVQDPRGEQFNQVDGKTVFPNVRGPSFSHTKTRKLPDPDLIASDAEEGEWVDDYSDLSEEESRIAGLSRIAAVSVQDNSLMQFDEAMTAAHSSIQTLSRAAEQLLLGIQYSNPTPEELRQVTELRDISQKVLEGWHVEMDRRFNEILSFTEEANPQNSQPGQTLPNTQQDPNQPFTPELR